MTYTVNIERVRQSAGNGGSYDVFDDEVYTTTSVPETLDDGTLMLYRSEDGGRGTFIAAGTWRTVDWDKE